MFHESLLACLAHALSDPSRMVADKWMPSMSMLIIDFVCVVYYWGVEEFRSSDHVAMIRDCKAELHIRNQERCDSD
jgi:hypothetical protein